jgi:hypothetical protein
LLGCRQAGPAIAGAQRQRFARFSISLRRGTSR